MIWSLCDCFEINQSIPNSLHYMATDQLSVILANRRSTLTCVPAPTSFSYEASLNHHIFYHYMVSVPAKDGVLGLVFKLLLHIVLKLN